MAFTSDILNIAQNSATDSHTRVQQEQGKRPLSGRATIPACPVATLIASIKTNIQASILTYISQPGGTTKVVSLPGVEAMTRAFPPRADHGLEDSLPSRHSPKKQEHHSSKSLRCGASGSCERKRTLLHRRNSRRTRRPGRRALRLARLQKRLGKRRSRTN